MTELKPLTYDEQKAAEAAFAGSPLNPRWTEAAQLLYATLIAEMSRQTEAPDSLGRTQRSSI